MGMGDKTVRLCRGGFIFAGDCPFIALQKKNRI